MNFVYNFINLCKLRTLFHILMNMFSHQQNVWLKPCYYQLIMRDKRYHVVEVFESSTARWKAETLIVPDDLLQRQLSKLRITITRNYNSLPLLLSLSGCNEYILSVCYTHWNGDHVTSQVTSSFVTWYLLFSEIH